MVNLHDWPKKQIAKRRNSIANALHFQLFHWNVRCVGLLIVLSLLPVSIAGAVERVGVPNRPFVCPLFADHVVLQRDRRVPVWGCGAPGQKVTVSFAGQTTGAVVNKEGEWMATLNPMPASSSPRILTVRGSSSQSVTVKDVLVGDIWLCSGQSNMEFPLKSATNGQVELRAANYQNIRLFTTANVTPETPQSVLPAGFLSWQPCTPKSAAEFSAVGYFFGRQLQSELHVPIGLIDSCWGGTPIESWISSDALRAVPGYASVAAEVESDTVQCRRDFSNNAAAFVENWFANNDQGSVNYKWAEPGFDDAKWLTVLRMPEPWNKFGLSHAGVVWFRRDIELPPNDAGRSLTISLGTIDSQDITWFNGSQIGSQLVSWRKRVYHVPGRFVKAGRNTLAVRVYCDRKGGGFTGVSGDMEVTPEEGYQIDLSSNWLWQAGASLKQLGRMPWRVGADPMVPATLFDGKIAPLAPFALRGVIWYQGEGNTGEPQAYRNLLTALISDWRRRFDSSNFPFGIVQLASFKQRSPRPQISGWAEVREAQAQVARTVPHCGLAVTIDIGDANDIHPKDKQDVGRRLALWALADTYGKDIQWSGPQYKNMRVEGNHIRINFDHTGGGLVANGGSLRGFAVAGNDRKFVWAGAVVDGDSVVVSSISVPQPTAVRYAWADNPDCNLYNKAGLPAVPFRTDSWPDEGGP